MELMWLVYIISLLTKVNSIAVIVCSLGAVLTVIALIGFLLDEDRADIVLAKRAAVVATLGLVVSILVPPEKTLYIMAGAYATQKVITHPEVRDMSEDVLVIIKNKLKQYADESIDELEGLKKNDNQN